MREGYLATSSVTYKQASSSQELPAHFTGKALPVQSFSYKLLKRTFDIAVCCLLFPFAGILMLLLALFALSSAGLPIFYRQERIGRNGKAFTLYKFRTMRTDGAEVLAEWFELHPWALEEWEKSHKLKDDPRITRGGRFLRETSLDELPQIFNVLRGEMSLVGPRPITKAELTRYGKSAGFYLAAVPGLTGAWQVSGRCNVSYEQRVGMDAEYVRHWSLWQDVKILLRTPWSVFRRDGAC